MQTLIRTEVPVDRSSIGLWCRPKTKAQDWTCVRDVICRNEYRLPKSFRPDDIVVDIGANIGTFALACLVRGAGHVFCFEPDAQNFAILKKNLEPYRGRYEAFEEPVWRSDIEEGVNFYHRTDSGTSMGFCLPDAGCPVAAKLDDILRSCERVRLLKIDAEGSEYPILHTSKELHRVDEIVGELHPQLIRKGVFPEEWDCSTVGMVKLLTDNGFKVRIEPHNEYPLLVQLFWAKR